MPILEVVALYLANAKPRAGEVHQFFANAVHNGLFVPLSAVGVLSFFFLPLLSSMAGAFPIAGEAEMGTMKTWLARPVTRGAVLLSKWSVAVLYVAIGMALVTAGGFVAGGIAFGIHPLVPLSGTTVSVAHGIGLVLSPTCSSSPACSHTVAGAVRLVVHQLESHGGHRGHGRVHRAHDPQQPELLGFRQAVHVHGL